MATGLRRKRFEEEAFKIHEDMAFREDTPMINDVVAHLQSTLGEEDEDQQEGVDQEEDDDQGHDYQNGHYGDEEGDGDDNEAHDDEEVILGEGVEDDDEEAETAKSEAEEGLDDDHDGQDQEDGEGEGEEEEDEGGDTSDDDAVDETVQYDMEKLQATFLSFRNQFRLIKRIGEGMSPPTFPLF